MGSGPRWWPLAVGGPGVLVLSLLAVLTRPVGSEVAMWWPASALSAWTVVAVPPRLRLAAVLVVSTAVAAGNGLTGRGLAVSVGFGLCNGLEALAVGSVLSCGGRRPALRSTADLRRLLTAVACGASVIALTCGPVAWALLGADPVRTGASVFASHGSALLLLLPLVLELSRERGDAGAGEHWVLVVLLALLVVVTFGPAHDLPISLVPLAVLVLSAMRCGTRSLLLQNAGAAGLVTALTLAGSGPYAAAARTSADPLVAVNLVQLYSLIVTSVVLAVACLTQERRAALQEVARLSTSDLLTGAGNRRLLEERIGQAAAHAARGVPTTLLLLDLDDFKAVNDADGHVVGDRVLVAVADRLRALLRPTDTLVRLGGDEFVVLLHAVAVGSEAAHVLQGRLRAAVGEPYEGTARRIGASVGVASVGPGAQLEGLLAEADRGMYDDKRQRKGAPAAPDLPGPRPVPWTEQATRT